MSCQIPANQLKRKRLQMETKIEKTRAKGNDVITNVISANQHLASTLVASSPSYSRHAARELARRLIWNLPQLTGLLWGSRGSHTQESFDWGRGGALTLGAYGNPGKCEQQELVVYENGALWPCHKLIEGSRLRGLLAKSLGYLAMVTTTDKRTVFSSQALIV